jgi:hypothetical protein
VTFAGGRHGHFARPVMVLSWLGIESLEAM